MRISSPDAESSKKYSLGKTKTLAASGAFLCAALMLSFAESLIFPAGILPIPGAKPGLANAAILMCAHSVGRRYAGAVSLCRVILMFFLFGNGTSVIYSLSGATLSFLGIAVLCNKNTLSFLGKSVIAAVLHNTAQVLCAVFILGTPALALFGWMMISALICGSFTGIMLNLSYKAVYGSVKKLLPNGK